MEKCPIATLASQLVDRVRTGFLPREPRTRVLTPARMCAGGKWTDITILNISSRGLMARSSIVPPQRSYIEIRRGPSVVIVGKVVWHDDRHFGIRAQDRIHIGMMTDDGAVTATPHDPAMERRAGSRAHKMDPAEAFERSRHRAALFQFATLAGGGIASALALGKIVMTALSAPLSIVASHLG